MASHHCETAISQISGNIKRTNHAKQNQNQKPTAILSNEGDTYCGWYTINFSVLSDQAILGLFGKKNWGKVGIKN